MDKLVLARWSALEGNIVEHWSARCYGEKGSRILSILAHIPTNLLDEIESAAGSDSLFAQRYVKKNDAGVMPLILPKLLN